MNGFDGEANNETNYKTFYDGNDSSQQIENDHHDGPKYTMQEAIDHIGFGKFQVKISVIAGLFYMSDAMELMVLAILAPVLECTWNLTPLQKSSLSSAVFLGSILSSIVWGKTCDTYGRKSSLILAAAMNGYFGLLSSLSPAYGWLLFLRFLVGISIGCGSQGMTYYAEFLPTQRRSPCLLMICFMWTLGTCLSVAMAALTIPTLGWRWFMVLVAMPSLAFCCLFKVFPESPRFHLAHGHYAQALKQMEIIAQTNGKKLPSGVLYDPCTQKIDENRLSDIWTPRYRYLSFLVCTVWLTSHFAYFGTAIITTELFELKDGCHGYGADEAGKSTSHCSIHCVGLDAKDYQDILLTALGEVPGVIFAVFVLHQFGRRRGIFLMALIYSVMMGICNICTPRAVLVAILSVARALAVGFSQSVMVYCTEVYPTSIRAIAAGWGVSCEKFGVTLTPFVGQGLMAISPYIAISIYCVIGLLCALAAILLPVETALKSMPDTLDGQ